MSKASVVPWTVLLGHRAERRFGHDASGNRVLAPEELEAFFEALKLMAARGLTRECPAKLLPRGGARQ